MSAELEEVVAAAEAARDALVRLSKSVQKIPGTQINLVRSIELLEQLSERARRAGFRADPAAEATLVRSLTASLAALQATGSPLGEERSAEIEKKIRRALARENGAIGGKKMSDRKRAALARLHESRRAAAAKVKELANCESPTVETATSSDESKQGVLFGDGMGGNGTVDSNKPASVS